MTSFWHCTEIICVIVLATCEERWKGSKKVDRSHSFPTSQSLEIPHTKQITYAGNFLGWKALDRMKIFIISVLDLGIQEISYYEETLRKWHWKDN